MDTSTRPCDFCTSTPVVARHRIDARQVPPWEDEPRGGWLACQTCHDLIVAEDRDGLAHRVARQAPEFSNDPIHIAEFKAIEQLDIFWQLDAGIWEPFPLV